jgi:ribosome-binding protein aMBF1 (putative translation factor)
MRGGNVADTDGPKGACDEKCVMRGGGRPCADDPDFAAAAPARAFAGFPPGDEISICDVQAGIRFDIPRRAPNDAGRVTPRDRRFFKRIDGIMLDKVTNPSAQCRERAENPVDRIVGAAIGRRRLQLGMARDELSVAADIESGVIADYETGRKRVRAEHLRLIAIALDVAPEYFFNEWKWQNRVGRS